MQVVQTANDIIKVLYSPNMENLCLGDFLLVQERKKRFLAQIINIHDEKSDLSQNVAQIKLLFMVNENDEVLPYDNHTPSKECKILHTRQKDIEEFVNIGKDTFELATNPKTGLPLEFNIDFFENKPLVFSDKLEQTNVFFCNLAKKLAIYKNIIVFDYTGSLEIEDAKRITAVTDFKLPFNVQTLDSIWEKGMSQSSLETQAIIEEIFNEVKNVLKEEPDGYLPFNRFLKVIIEQYVKTPITELLVLRNRLKRYQQQEIFARNKKDFQIKTKMTRNKVVIVDLSKLKTEWHKEFMAFVLDNIKKNSFVLARLNDINTDADFIKEMYERDLSLIPSVSYAFKRMASIVEYCPNLIMLPTLNPRRDFGYVNGSICALDQHHALLWGEDTKNFIFTIKNEIHCLPQEDNKGEKPVKMKFVGSEEILDFNIDDVQTDDQEVQDFLDLKHNEQNPQVENKSAENPYNILPSEHIDEPSSVAYKPVYEFSQSTAQEQSVLADSVSIDDVDELVINDTVEQDIPPIVENEYYEDYAPAPPSEPVEAHEDMLISEEELDFFEKYSQAQLIEDTEDAAMPSAVEEFQEEYISASFPEENAEEYTEKEIIKNPLLEDVPIKEEVQEEPQEEIIQEEYDEDSLYEPMTEENQVEELIEEIQIEEIPPAAKEIIKETIKEEIIEKVKEEPVKETPPLRPIIETIEDDTSLVNKSEICYTVEEENLTSTVNTPKSFIEEIDEEEPLSQVTPIKQTRVTPAEDVQKPAAKETPKKAEPEAPAIKNAQEIEDNFDKMLDESTKNLEDNDKLVINENVSIDLSKIKEHIPTDDDNLPIFPTDAVVEGGVENFSEGDDVEHDKYGHGKVTKVVNYANRCLLQIEFSEVGKRLLDPRIAHIRKPVQAQE